MGQAFSFLISKINPIAVVITLLVASFATLWKTNEKFRNKVIGGKILIDNDQLKLRPGMFAKADIIVDRADSSIIIPKDVILSNRRRKYVYIVEKNTAKIRNLQTGLEDEYNIEILSGLNVNDNLVVKGFETLKEDAKVKIQK